MNRRHRFGVPVSIALGLGTIALGTWGWSLADSGLDLSDSVYRAFQLFAMEDSGVTSPPWQLGAARFLGALAVATALLTLIFSYLSDSADLLAVRFFARDHHVVVGTDSRSRALAESLADDGQRVVVIDPETGVEGAATHSSDNLPRVTGNPEKPRTYRKARQIRARHAFFCLGDDSRNLIALEASLAEEASHSPKRGERTHLTRYVAIDDPALWSTLHRASFRWTGPGAAIQFVSIPDLVASLLVGEIDSTPRSERILVCGTGPTAERTVIRAARKILFNGRRPVIHLGSATAGSLLADLSRNEPWLIEGESADVLSGESPIRPGIAFVVGLNYGETLATVANLLENDDELVVVAEVPYREGVEALRRSGYPVDRVKLIPAEARVLGARAFEFSPREEIARARHQHYLEEQDAKGISTAENPSLVAWEDLPSALRDSNRMFADSVGKRLADLDARLVPLTGPAPAPLEENLIEDLARVEHQRWIDDLASDGWRVTAGEKDPERKLHPLMVGFDELSADEKEKDLDSIRRLPEALARVGYEIRLESIER